MRAFGAALIPLFLAACSTVPRIEEIVVDDSSRGIRDSVAIVAGAQRAFSVIQPITALSCKRLAWDPDASEVDAISQLQIKAARLKADGLANVRCESPLAATLQPNCWKSVVCHGDAVRIE